MNAITNNTAAANETAAAANTNGLTITVKPYGVTVKVGQAGYITEATIFKFNDSRHLAAALLTGGVKLAANPHLITTLQPSNMALAYFFHQLDVLMSQGLAGVLLGDGVAPHIPEGLWEKKSRREAANAKRRAIATERLAVRRAKVSMQAIESDQEVVEKPMPVEAKRVRREAGLTPLIEESVVLLPSIVEKSLLVADAIKSHGVRSVDAAMLFAFIMTEHGITDERNTAMTQALATKTVGYDTGVVLNGIMQEWDIKKVLANLQASLAYGKPSDDAPLLESVKTYAGSLDWTNDDTVVHLSALEAALDCL